MSHRNAPLTPEGRRRLCVRVDSGRPICHVAAEAGIARQTLGKWHARWLQFGWAGLQNRSSRNATGWATRTETVTIRIPPGVPERATLRLAGQGTPSPMPGGPAGDVYVRIHTRTDPLFRRVGADLWHDLHLQAPDAARGVTMTVPLPGVQTRVRVPPGTQPGSVLRVAGMGLPRYEENGRGNLQLTVILDIPRQLNRRQRQLYEQLRTADTPSTAYESRSAASESGYPEAGRADQPMAANSDARDAAGSLFIFASMLLLIAGVTNVVGGIAAISASDRFIAGTPQVPGPSIWGWIMIVVGVLELLGAIAVWAGRRASRRKDHSGGRRGAASWVDVTPSGDR